MTITTDRISNGRRSLNTVNLDAEECDTTRRQLLHEDYCKNLPALPMLYFGEQLGYFRRGVLEPTLSFHWIFEFNYSFSFMRFLPVTYRLWILALLCWSLLFQLRPLHL